MNLQTHINSELWKAMANTYEAKNYSHAILDAMHFLSDELRQRSGAEGDGVALVGEALGGTTPKLKINKNQTQSEKDEQKGFEAIIRGLYVGIRNPRSHEQSQDSKETADAIIHFISYIVGILGKSLPPFSIEIFIEKVFDKHFVNSQRYAELLVSEIPAKQLLDLAIEIFRQKERIDDLGNLRRIYSELQRRMTTEQLQEFYTIVSDELRIIQSSDLLQYIFYIIEPNQWRELSETARLRVENMVLNSLSSGQGTYKKIDEYESVTKSNNEGQLGLWAQEHLPFFDCDVGHTLAISLFNTFAQRTYILTFFGRHFPKLIPADSDIEHIAFIALKTAIESDLGEIYDEIEAGAESYLEDLAAYQRVYFSSLPQRWQEKLRTKLPPSYFSLLSRIPLSDLIDSDNALT